MMTITVSRRMITHAKPITLSRPANTARQSNFWTILLRALSAVAC